MTSEHEHDEDRHRPDDSGGYPGHAAADAGRAERVSHTDHTDHTDPAAQADRVNHPDPADHFGSGAGHGGAGADRPSSDRPPQGRPPVDGAGRGTAAGDVEGGAGCDVDGDGSPRSVLPGQRSGVRHPGDDRYPGDRRPDGGWLGVVPGAGRGGAGGPRSAPSGAGAREQAGARGWWARAVGSMARGVDLVTRHALGPYQTAVVRIGFAATWLLFLLREWPHRDQLYGPGSPWGWELAEKLVDSNGAFTVLLWSRSGNWFEFVYLFAIAASVALLLGWRTRTASVLFMVGVLGLQNRSVFMGDGGDNVIHLMAMYLVLTRCGQVWSLDARRAARRARRPRPAAAQVGEGAGDTGRVGAVEQDGTGVVLWSLLGAILLGATSVGGFSVGWALFFWGLWVVYALWWALERFAPGGEVRRVCDLVANLAHNGALFVIMAEVCLIYATAGWYKIQGSRWQDGTAAYYPMHLDYFSPWPWLSDLFTGSGLVILVMTYLTVIVQVAFPFTLFNRRVKNVLLAIMIAEHLSIAVLLGLPFFSLAMIAADAVFLPTVALMWLGARASGLTRRLGRRLPARLRPADEPPAEGVAPRGDAPNPSVQWRDDRGEWGGDRGAPLAGDRRE